MYTSIKKNWIIYQQPMTSGMTFKNHRLFTKILLRKSIKINGNKNL